MAGLQHTACLHLHRQALLKSKAKTTPFTQKQKTNKQKKALVFLTLRARHTFSPLAPLLAIGRPKNSETILDTC